MCGTGNPIRKAVAAFTPFTITGGSNQSRGENGYWNVSKMVLLSELAAHLESGRLRINQHADGPGADR